MLKSAPSLTTVLRGRNVFRTLRVVLGSTRHCNFGRFPAWIHSLMAVRMDLFDVWWGSVLVLVRGLVLNVGVGRLDLFLR